MKLKLNLILLFIVLIRFVNNMKEFKVGSFALVLHPSKGLNGKILKIRNIRNDGWITLETEKYVVGIREEDLIPVNDNLKSFL